MLVALGGGAGTGRLMTGGPVYGLKMSIGRQGHMPPISLNTSANGVAAEGVSGESSSSGSDPWTVADPWSPPTDDGRTARADGGEQADQWRSWGWSDQSWSGRDWRQQPEQPSGQWQSGNKPD